MHIHKLFFCAFNLDSRIFALCLGAFYLSHFLSKFATSHSKNWKVFFTLTYTTPLTLDLKVRASVSELVDGFLSSYYSNKVDSKYSSLATRVRRPKVGTFNQSLPCGFAPYFGSQTRSALKQNFEDFLSVGKETTPAVPVPITSIYKKI